MKRVIHRRRNCYHPQKLKGLLISYGFDPPARFGPVMGVSEKTMRKKVCGDHLFTRSQLLFIKSYFRLTAEQFCDIFYDTSEVQDKVSIKMLERVEEMQL